MNINVVNLILVSVALVAVYIILYAIGIYITSIREPKLPPDDPRYKTAMMAMREGKPVFWSEETGYVVMGENGEDD